MKIYPPQGFYTAGIHCGLKPNGNKDMALFVSEQPCAAAGVFTTNRIKAAPVTFDQEIIRQGKPVRAIVANAGNANACTGEQGMRNAYAMAEYVAQKLGCEVNEVLVLSTGVIGVQLPMNTVYAGIDAALEVLAPVHWEDAAQAIMTTDTRPKIFSQRIAAQEYSVTGVAKGSGMIAPDMATMLSVIATDVSASQAYLQQELRLAASQSFNRIVVDGDMSTNDTVLLLANGASGAEAEADSHNFRMLLNSTCKQLAMEIVRDGEGATKFVTLNVNGAPSDEAAEAVARSIATSPLCKTAFYGADPNWGRIIAAAGRSGVPIELDQLNLWLINDLKQQRIQLLADGQPTDLDEPAAIALMQDDRWTITLDLGMGAAETTVWTCDLSHDYVTINGHYRT